MFYVMFQNPFRRKLLEQQAIARMNGGHQSMTSSISGMVQGGGNVMGTPNSQRGLNSMSPAPQQMSRPRKIIFLFACILLFCILLHC